MIIYVILYFLLQGEERVRLTQEYAVNDLKLDVALPDTPPPHQVGDRVSGRTLCAQHLRSCDIMVRGK